MIPTTDRRHVGLRQAEQIDMKNQRTKPQMATRFCRFKCLVCGAAMRMFTKTHARSHGLTKEDMITRKLVVQYKYGRGVVS